MYYILIETETILPAWLEEMEESNELKPQVFHPSTNTPPTSSGLSAPMAVPSEGESFSSYGELPTMAGLGSEIRGVQLNRAAVSTDRAESSTVAPTSERKRSTFNILDTMVKPVSPMPQLKKSLAFTTGNPTIETTKGIIHLYNDHPTPGQIVAVKASKIVCIVAVPTWLSISDLHDHLGVEFTSKMDALRVLADSSPNKYMVVLKFRELADAETFVYEFNGKPFSCMSENNSPELCHLAYVKYVDFIKPLGKSKQESLASSTLFPYSTLAGPTLIELPTCPVCLERLDSSVSGLLTILCQHTFHCNCLIQWKEDNTCPVCRFTQQPAGHDSLCAKCGTHDELWICLLCGHVGCSRYQESHAQAHYKETLHNYALELSTQRVWDYAGDGYVHRLIQNKTDGKLVELPPPHAHSNARTESGDDKENLPKVDAISLEYQYLLTAQLETQRAWFEQKMREMEEIRSRHIRELEQQQKLLKDQLSKTQHKAKQLESDREQQLTESIEKDRSIKELQEQIRDLMVYLDARSAIGKESELIDGQVVMLSNPDAKIAAATSSSAPTTPAREALRRKLAKRKKQAENNNNK